MNAALAGHRILLTRPEGQVGPITDRLRASGAKIAHFPAIRVTLLPPNRAALATLARATILVFASANAARGLASGPDSLTRIVPHSTKIAAIGPATARTLRELGLKPELVAPPPHDSEALLSMPDLRELERQRVIIARGRGGRETLAEEMRRRGADTRYLEVYRRDPPTRALSFTAMPGGRPEAICVTSVEVAENLLRCVAKDEASMLQESALIAGNARIATACRKLGYTALAEIADNPGDDAMIDALIRHFAKARAT